MQKYLGSAMGAAILMALAAPAFAQDLRVNVPVGQGGSLTSPTVSAAEETLRKIPGGADVIPAKEFQDGYALSMKDMLNATPGVLAQPRWGEESRLSIRGSGLSRSFHMRGITLLQDGIPFTFADGSSDFQEIDPLTLQHVEIYRGGQGLRYGAATLGGAVNMVTPTGKTLPHTVLLRTEGGSHKTLRLHAQAGKAFDGADAFVATTSAVSSSFRRQSEQNNRRVSGNIGVDLGSSAETRFYIAYNDLEQEVPGTISKRNALHNPKRVPAINVLDDYARDIHSLRLANRTAFRLDNGWKLEGGVYANDKTLYHPIFRVLDQKSLDVGTFARLDGDYSLQSHRNEFVLGANLGRGRNNAKQFENEGGKRGALRADAKQLARNIELYGENRFFVTPDLSLITGLQGRIAYRDFEDHLNGANDAEKTYKALNPKLGILYKTTPSSEVYASVTRSSEAPTYSELVQGGLPGFVPVDQQTAWTAEVGSRGTYEAFSWDATLYHARVRKELLNFTVDANTPASTFNAGDTIHQGIELGLGWQATPELSFHGIYNLNDFRFDGDDQFGDNDLAGAPPHQVRLSARYERDGYYIEPNVEWTPKAAWVDYANTLKSDTPVLVGMKAGLDIGDNVSLFIDARNLMNEQNIATFSTITDARVVGTEVFYPGDGRSVYGGIVVKF